MLCDHTICDTCVEIFGEGLTGFESRYVIRKCPLCQLECALVVKLKPPTAGVRVASIDGGGTRGIIPLRTLGLMQQTLGSDCKVQDLFDMAFGTSAGNASVMSPVVHSS